MMVDTGKMRRQAKCVFLATEECIARDLSNTLNVAADEIDRLRAPDRVENEQEDQKTFLGGLVNGLDGLLKALGSRYDLGSYVRFTIGLFGVMLVVGTILYLIGGLVTLLIMTL